jgi:hypothetical protein
MKFHNDQKLKRQLLTVFPSDFNNSYLILQNLMRNGDFTKSMKVTKVTKGVIFHSIFLVKSLIFVPFCSIAMYFVNFRFHYQQV